LEYLRLVLPRFKEEGLEVTSKKCFFGLHEMEYLGYILSVGEFSVVHVRHQRHPHPPSLHSVGLQRRAGTLSRELDTEDLQLNLRIFEHLQHRWGPHTIDRFASMLNAQLPRFNARWRDPLCENIDCLHMSDAASRRENNYCNPPWSALPAMAAKLAQ
jgi:hypothetical protein